MKNEEAPYASVNMLIEKYDFFLKYYSIHFPFKKPEQLSYHIKTITRRRELGSAKAALNDQIFLKNLYDTIKAWGIGSRGSILRPYSQFVNAIEENADRIISLDGIRLDQDIFDSESISRSAWSAIKGTRIVENKTILVPCSKTLHHILPDLIVPIDREYTQIFFGWQNPTFQYSQEYCFEKAFKEFRYIAQAVNPSQYVGEGWNTSLTKNIDNAIVGFIVFIKNKLLSEKSSH